MAAVPDPRHGIFETLLVVDGHPVDLDAHMERLSASLAKLFPDLQAPNLGEMDVPVKRGSLRITAIPTGKELEVQTSLRTVEQQFKPVTLHSLTVPGGLGEHKWADRSSLDEAQASLPADGLPLIVNSDGAVLEASRANVFAVRNGALLTPPTDGRILPGITRARVIEIAALAGIEVEETSLRREDLLAADEVFLTSSVRGIELVSALDGARLIASGEVATGLAATLLETWTGAKVG
jgi:para-aminobenzoate synthetase / 4-amino-4-deoxychorismate lyase